MTTNLKPVHNANPNNDHMPDFKASLPVLCIINSPTIAPIKGPPMMPIGPKKSPITSPIVAHRVPALLPPNFFVPHIGTI